MKSILGVVLYSTALIKNYRYLYTYFCSSEFNLIIALHAGNAHWYMDARGKDNATLNASATM